MSDYSALLIDADALDDLEKVRIATKNRIQALTANEDGFGKGIVGSQEEKRARALLDLIEQAEQQATRNLERSMRATPLGPFVERTIGLGLKQTARLLAATGNPADRPNPAKLWAYCGLHVVDGAAPRRRRGQQGNWSTAAKTRAYLVAVSCMKQTRSPYRAVYDRERAKWADRATTDLHKHHHALRVVAKEVLKDLWREARTIRGAHPIVATSAPALELVA